MDANEKPRRVCGNCRFCRHRPTRGGVQQIATENLYQCYVAPPQAYLFPNKSILTIRPPVDENDPACGKWQPE